MKSYLRIKENSSFYRCALTWYEGGKLRRKEISTGNPIKGNNKRKAEQRCEEIRQEYEQKYEGLNLSSCLANEVTFDEYMESWLETEKRFIRETTYYGYKKVVTRHIVPYFKDKKILLIDLAPMHLQEYYNFKLDNGLSAATVRRHHANIRKALQDALSQNIIPYNAADRTKLPSAVKYHANTYNEQQIADLIKASTGTPLESTVILCIYYGLRRGEVCGLRWSDVDLDNRILHISNTRTTAKDEIFQNTTKTKSSNRELPINDVMFKYLTELKAKQNANKAFLGERYNTSDFVCCWDDGEPVKVTHISHMFTKLLADNNLPHIRLHDLRHSCATNLLKKGVDIKIIQEYLGHSTIVTPANFYLHPDMEQTKDAIERLSQAFAI